MPKIGGAQFLRRERFVRQKEDSRIPEGCLGQSPDNTYGPVCVGWTGHLRWEKNCGSLWWSAASMGLPVLESRVVAEVSPTVDLVPIEFLMVMYIENRYLI